MMMLLLILSLGCCYFMYISCDLSNGFNLFIGYLHQVDIPIKQSFLWYEASSGDEADGQVHVLALLMRQCSQTILFVVFHLHYFSPRHQEHIFSGQMVHHQFLHRDQYVN